MKTKQRDQLLTPTSFPPVTLVLAEAKGGVGKSMIAHVSKLVLRDNHPDVNAVLGQRHVGVSAANSTKPMTQQDVDRPSIGSRDANKNRATPIAPIPQPLE